MSPLSTPLNEPKFLAVVRRKNESSPVRMTLRAIDHLHAINGVLKTYGRNAQVSDFDQFDLYEYTENNSLILRQSNSSDKKLEAVVALPPPSPVVRLDDLDEDDYKPRMFYSLEIG